MGQDPGISDSVSVLVNLGHIYGDNLERQYQLRLFKDGKLKYQVALGLGAGVLGRAFHPVSSGRGCWWGPLVVSCGRSCRCLGEERQSALGEGADRREADKEQAWTTCSLGSWIWGSTENGQIQSAFIHLIILILIEHRGVPGR